MQPNWPNSKPFWFKSERRKNNVHAPHDLTPILVEIFRTVLQASWQGALAIVLVLIVRRALGTRVPARWHYLLWFLVLARLLVPAGVLPRSPASLENIPAVARPFARQPVVNLSGAASTVPPAFASTASLVSAPMAAVIPPSAASAAIIRPRTSWWLWAAWGWLGGVLLLAVWLAACVVGLRRRLRQGTFPAEEEVLEVWRTCCRRWLRRTPPRLRTADWVYSPALVGWWRPTLLVPRRSLHAFSTQDWEHVFAHEIAHLRWRDHWTQSFLLVAGIIHWFNPIVWFGWRRLRADRELAADEWVLRHLEDERALAYGETLFKTLAGRPIHAAFQPGMVGISEDGAQMKQRLRRIAAFLPQRRLLSSLAGVTAVLGLAAVVLGQGTPDQPAKASAAVAPASPRTEQSLRDDLLAAARAADARRVEEMLYAGDPKLRARSGQMAIESLDDLLRRGETTAFTTLHDASQHLWAGRDWKPSDALLLALVKEDRTDALDALMAGGLDLKRLAEPARSADAPTADWIQRRVAEVNKQRVDISALEKAAGDGDLDAIRHLLDAGVDVNAFGPDNNTPLARAASKNRLEAAQLLLDRGAQVDKVRWPGWDCTPLCLAASVPMAELLKSHGADVHAKLFGQDASILAYVAPHADFEVVDWVLRQGLDPKQIGHRRRNLLFELKDARTAERLLALGVDPNQADDSGNPPLCFARSAAVAQMLLAHGARVTGFEQPLLPNMISFASAPIEVITTALDAGADHDPATLQTAIDRVDAMGTKDDPNMEKVRRLLLSYGAQPTPASQGVRPSHHYAVRVTAADGTLLGGDSTLIHAEQSFGPPNQIGVSTMGGNVSVEANGTAPIWIEDTATTAVMAAASDGFATAYAGPFTPPTKEKLDAVSFWLERGFRATVETVDDAGRPIAGTQVIAYYPGPPKMDLGAAVTDTAGHATFEHVGTAPLTIQASADGYEADTVTAAGLDPIRPYRWALKKASSLAGVVVAADTSQPVAGAKIKLAGVRGPHDETHGDPAEAPLLATSDPQGRFTLTTLRPDSAYDLFVEAPGHGGVVLNGVKTGQAELRASLGPELTVRGKATHVPAGWLYQGQLTLNYSQIFKIGDGFFEVGKSWEVRPVNGEADFVTVPLYDSPVSVQARNIGVRLEAKDLPKTDLVLDLVVPLPTPESATPTPASATPTPTLAPTSTPGPTAGAKVVNPQGQPVARVSIRPYTEVRGDTWSYPASKHQKTHTDPEGRFNYSVPGYTKVGVMVVAPGYARQLVVVPYGDPLADIVLGPGVEVTGRLLKDGQPVPGVDMGIVQLNHDSYQFLDEIVATTDHDGRFVLAGVAPKDHLEVHAKRDSSRTLGVMAPKLVNTGEPGTTLSVGDLSMEPGVTVTGRIMLPDGSLPDPEYYVTEPDGKRTRETNRSVQLHVYREGAYDYQYIDLGPDLRFSFPALPGEETSLSAWVPGYKLRGKEESVTVRVSPDPKPVEMVYDPESTEAKERALHPVFTSPSIPTPAPPSVEQLAADTKAAQTWADKLAAQPHHTEAEWREQIRKVTVGMTWEEVVALLPQKTVSIDYMQRDEFDEEDLHTSIYALDGEFAVALTFDFKGDKAWNAAGQPKPRPKADENHLARPPILMRHDKKPDPYNEIRLENAHRA